MRFILILLFLIVNGSYCLDLNIKWRTDVSQLKNIKIFRDCGNWKVYEGKRFKGFNPDKVFYSFYLNKLYKVSLKYDSFYDFVEDADKIKKLNRSKALSVESYETEDTVIKIIHTPVSNRIEFIYKLYYPRIKLIEKCD
ncbi:hypothetical protein [Persephonella sp.]